MKDPILESLNTIRRLESPEVLNEAAVAAPAAAIAGKGIGRFIPGVGAALGAYDAYGRAKQGDWAGAGLSALGGAASLIPGIGTAASLGIAGAQALRDKQRTGSYMPGDDEIAAGVAKDAATQPTATAAAPAAAPARAGADPKVLALQKQLIAKGAKITADGKMGPATQAAMKQFPGTAVAEHNKGNDMSESQRIAELMSRLAQIESTPQIADEGIADLAKGAWQGVKGVGNFFKGAKAGMQGGSAASNVASGAANLGKAGDKGMAAAQAVKGAGQAVKTAATSNTAKNIAKVGAGAAVGAGTMAALGTGAATKPAAAPAAAPTKSAPDPKVLALQQELIKNGAKIKADGIMGPATIAAQKEFGTAPAAAQTTPTAPASSLTTDEEGEMGVLAQELSALMGANPELDAALLQYEKLRPGAADAAP